MPFVSQRPRPGQQLELGVEQRNCDGSIHCPRIRKGSELAVDDHHSVSQYHSRTRLLGLALHHQVLAQVQDTHVFLLWI